MNGPSEEQPARTDEVSTVKLELVVLPEQENYKYQLVHAAGNPEPDVAQEARDFLAKVSGQDVGIPPEPEPEVVRLHVAPESSPDASIVGFEPGKYDVEGPLVGEGSHEQVLDEDVLDTILGPDISLRNDDDSEDSLEARIDKLTAAEKSPGLWQRLRNWFGRT